MHLFWKNLEMLIFLYITVEAEIMILAKNVEPIETLVLYKHQRSPKVKLTFDLSSKVTHIGTAFYISKHLFLRIQWVA